LTYIGQQPSTTFDSGIQDRFTGLTTNTVTLTHEISAEEDILVVWNNIVQDKNTYSVGGSQNKTLTLGGTLSSSDVVTVYYLNKVMQSVNPTAGSVTSTILGNDILSGQTDIGADIADADLFLVDDGAGGTVRKSAASRLKTYIGDNTPSFSAKLSSDQSCSSGAETVLAFATEQWDSDSKYNNSNYRFTPAVAGKYVINGLVMLNDITVQNKRLQLLIYKNGSFFADVETIASSETSTDPTLSINLLIEFNTTDYVELRLYHNTGSSEDVRSGYSFFQGYKLIGV